MIILQGDLYTDNGHYDYVGFTANSTLTKDGKLVMGAGTAKIVREKYKGIDKRLGDAVKGCSKFYIRFDKDTNIFALQTKIDWKDKSPINLVKGSIFVLSYEACKQSDKLFAIPFPAISNGGLKECDILPYLKTLPDNVHIWRL